MTAPKIGTWMWHVHHASLCEPLTEPLAKRIAYIKANKLANEIGTRLRWMTPVGGKMPVALLRAWAAYHKAGAAYDKAGAAYDKAWAAYHKAGAAYDKAGVAYHKAEVAYHKGRVAAQPALKRLHAKEHGSECPWDGEQLVFPR